MATAPAGNTYDKYGTGNPIEQRLMRGFFRAIDAALPSAAVRVLEIGCGEGEILDRLGVQYPEVVPIGVDLPDAELADEWQRGSRVAMFGDARTLPFPDDSFDLVVGVETLEHIDDPERALHELARVATGAAVFSVPREPVWRAANMARGKYWRDAGNTPGHINHWSSRGFVDFVSTRFDVTDVARPFPWTVVAARVR